MVARFEKTPRSVMFSGQDWMFKKPTKTERKRSESLKKKKKIPSYKTDYNVCCYDSRQWLRILPQVQ